MTSIVKQINVVYYCKTNTCTVQEELMPNSSVFLLSCIHIETAQRNEKERLEDML